MPFHVPRFAIPLAAAVVALLATSAGAEPARKGALPDLRIARGTSGIAEAWLADPTDRYRHFVLGSSYEAATLVARLQDGRELRLTLPSNAVFEDRQPRLADLDGDGRDEIVVVRSTQDKGAALVVVGVQGDRLSIVAAGPATGRPNTWLNPAGIADFDGDGRLDIAYVQMPHILGRLRVLTLRGAALVEIATTEDTSNHVAGSPRLGLSVVADFDGDGVADLALPSLDRRTLRILAFKGGVREIRRVRLPSPAVSDFSLAKGTRGPAVMVGLAAGKTVRVDQ